MKAFTTSKFRDRVVSGLCGRGPKVFLSDVSFTSPADIIKGCRLDVRIPLNHSQQARKLPVSCDNRQYCKLCLYYR